MIEWSEKFSVGNAALDAQHQHLFSVINELENLIADRSNEGHERFHIVLHHLSEYARLHFDTEERILQQLGYDGIVAHAKEHFAYREKMCDVLFDAINGEEPRRKLHEYLMTWWTTHVLEDDMAFKTAIKNFY